MKIHNASFCIYGYDFDDYKTMVEKIEYIARKCYNSKMSNNLEDGEEFIRKLIKKGHEAMIEHCSITVEITADRGILAELTRHRLASYAVQSSRYCNYSLDKFNNELNFINPTMHFKDAPEALELTETARVWKDAMEQSETAYMKLIELGEAPQMARSVLPMSLSTEMVITANLREWRNILKLRADKAAHPQMREIMVNILHSFISNYPVFFEDLKELYNEYYA